MIQRTDIFDVHSILWQLKLNQYFIRLSDEDAGKLIKAVSWFLLADPRAIDILEGNERLEENFDDISTVLLKKIIQNQVRNGAIDREEVPECTERLFNKRLYMAPSGRIRVSTREEEKEDIQGSQGNHTAETPGQGVPGPENIAETP